MPTILQKIRSAETTNSSSDLNTRPPSCIQAASTAMEFTLKITTRRLLADHLTSGVFNLVHQNDGRVERADTSFYVNDTYRKDRFTLNFGVRFDHQ